MSGSSSLVVCAGPTQSYTTYRDTDGMAARKPKHDPTDDYPTFDELSDDEKDYLVNQKVVYVPVEDLIPYDRNAKLHDNMTAYLRNMVKRVKFRVPIHLDENRVIISGHARRLVAIELGMKRVPCIFDTGMSPEDVRLQRLADNRLTELSDYDLDMLGIEVVELKEMGIKVEDFGLDFNFDDPLDGWEDEDAEEGEEMEEEGLFEGERDDGPFIRTGDVVMMGEHILVCGDALDPLCMQALMGTQTADIALTAPPVSLDDEGADYERFIMDAVSRMLDASHEVFLDLPLTSTTKATIAHLVGSRSESFKDMIYWVKSGVKAVAKSNAISSAVEPILCFGRDGSRAFRHMSHTYYGTIEGQAPSKTRKGIMPFPLYLPTEILDTFTEEYDVVLDPFAGSGTVLIACIDTQRIARLMELDPLMCDYIVRRYMEHADDTDVTVIRDGERLKYPTD